VVNIGNQTVKTENYRHNTDRRWK